MNYMSRGPTGLNDEVNGDRMVFWPILAEVSVIVCKVQ